MMPESLPETAMWVSIFQTLPSPGSVWPVQKREEWLFMMQSLFNILYKPDHWRAPEVLCGIPVVTLDVRRLESWDA
jgi:hypothetical protein